MKRLLAVFAVSVFLTTCSPATVVPTAAPSVVPTPRPTLRPGVYRPLERGDVIEGAKVDYVYILPSAENPAITVAAGERLLQLFSIKPEFNDSLVAYARDISQSPRQILAFDENDPNQSAPKPVTIDANKPVEYIVIRVEDGTKYWSVTDRQEDQVRAAYKLIRRSDGGLRFVDAYDLTALNTFGALITGGGGAGMVFSSRLALLKTILDDQGYQRGENVMATRVPDAKMYDPRILKVDPSKEGLAKNVDWVIQSRPGPNPGLQAP